MPLLTIATRDAWTSATLTWDDGINPAVAWSPSARTDAKAALDELVGLLGGGAWWQASRTSADAGMTATIYTGAAYTVTANAAAQSLLGYPATQGPSVVIVGGSWPGTVYTEWPTTGQSLLRWFSSPDGEGEPGIVPSSPGTTGPRPLLQLALSAVESSRLSAMLARAISPRACAYTDDPAASSPTWRALTMGRVERSQLGSSRWAATFEVRS